MDLPEQKVTVHTQPELSFSFEIDGSVKTRLIEGLDDIALTLQEEKAITAFEGKHNDQQYY